MSVQQTPLSRPATPAQSRYKVRTLIEHPSFDSGPETPTERDGSVGYAPSWCVTPTLSEDQVDAQHNKLAHPIVPEPEINSPECPICRKTFRRAQERNRHVQSHLPHSIYCPSQGCPWTGRRRWDLKTHWGKKHSETGQVLGNEKNKIYDPKELVQSIVDGTSHVGVAESAFLKAKERLNKLGKIDVGANVLGRKLDIET